MGRSNPLNGRAEALSTDYSLPCEEWSAYFAVNIESTGRAGRDCQPPRYEVLMVVATLLTQRSKTRSFLWFRPIFC